MRQQGARTCLFCFHKHFREEKPLNIIEANRMVKQGLPFAVNAGPVKPRECRIVLPGEVLMGTNSFQVSRIEYRNTEHPNKTSPDPGFQRIGLSLRGTRSFLISLEPNFTAFYPAMPSGQCPGQYLLTLHSIKVVVRISFVL